MPNPYIRPPAAPGQLPPATGSPAGLPGQDALTSSATGIIDDLLSGQPSTAPSRLKNAWYGAGTGLGVGSGFLDNRGYDLYRTEAEQNKNRGLEDMFKLMQTYYGTVAPTAGQNIQSGQFQQQLGRQQGLDEQAQNNLLRREYYDREGNNPLAMLWGVDRNTTTDTALPGGPLGGYAPAGTKRRY